jgi:hypothetical protein
LVGWNPRNNGINHLSTGAGFLPSTISQTTFMSVLMWYTGIPSFKSLPSHGCKMIGKMMDYLRLLGAPIPIGTLW